MNRIRVELGLPQGGAWLGPGRQGGLRRLELALEPQAGRLCLIEIEGVLGLGGGLARGEAAAVVSVRSGARTSWSLPLVAGLHWDEPDPKVPVTRFNGDGTWVESIGEQEVQGVRRRIDRLSLEMPGGLGPTSLTIGTLGDKTSFLVTAVRLHYLAAEGCPFHSTADAVPLRDIGPVLRTGDRLRFETALDQLRASISVAESDDEARSFGLTFVGVVGAAMLELGGPRSYHMAQLEAARDLIAAEGRQSIAQLAVRHAALLAKSALPQTRSGIDPACAQALDIVNRRYATKLTESQVAAEVGYSGSHFRFLFKRDLGVAFHRYLLGVRLEKARELLQITEASVSEIAEETGFSSASHFSRVFTQRFGNPPSAWRRVEVLRKTRQISHSVA
ncbi:MAG: helix-turn-helix transcriptional regulator [Fimbriimonadaceae bacterium]